MDEGREYITLTGTVASVIYQNPDNGYAVLRLTTEDGVVTAAGVMPGASEGEKLLLSGVWTTHKSFGRQFKTEGCEHIAPSGAEEIYQYLASGAIKSIGPAKARDIVDRFGDDALRIIENEPEKLSAVRGITVKRAREIGVGFRRQAGLRKLIDFFSQNNIKPVVATRLYKDYGDTSLDAVKENPYILAGEQYGADFSEADALALGLGFEGDSPERVSAAILFELTHNLQNGHVFIPREKLVAATDQLISAGRTPVFDALEQLCEEGEVIMEIVAGEEACYLRHMHEAESYIASRLAEMLIQPEETCDIGEMIGEIEREHGITYAAAQIGALELAVRRRVIAMTGGPGTGKTTTVRGILAMYDAFGYKTVLCAPTGRAAKRLGETCLRTAATIHRLLGACPDENGALAFEYDEENPLSADAVIVDESSMVDIMLMRALLSAIRPGTRLVLVGDADQLPPVGPGSVFADIIRSGAAPVIRLTEIFRQAEDSGIVKNAHKVNGGIIPELTEKHDDFFFLRRRTDEQIAETVAELSSTRLPQKMGIDPAQIQVLSPTRKGLAGTVALNQRLREAVNPGGMMKKERGSGEFIFRVGDKVMQIRNNYDIMCTQQSGDGGNSTGVFNGDVGVVADIDFQKETLTVEYEDKRVEYLFEQLTELEPAFAMTVHKSQGSEYHAVILALTGGAPQLLTRGILYTAMTRAKKLLILVGNPEIMAKMVENDRRQRRYCGLRARLTRGN